MSKLAAGWKIQHRVITALMIRELHTRFGRENIGFLWVMVEPLLFAGIVAFAWRLMKGPVEHGVDVVTFVISGYIPLTLFRHSITRCISVFVANGSLMYHRQVRVTDFIFTRFLIEMIGSMMAYVFIGLVLNALGLFPVPADMGIFMAGWLIYSLFTLSLCFIVAPLSEMSPVLEKFVPVTTYIMIPFSGTFNMASWLPPAVRDVLLWSPWVNAMEMMRYGIYGDAVRPYYSFVSPIVASLICLVFGLALCRSVRRKLVIE
jgi:capsular polysaccharide transport system permease protein